MATRSGPLIIAHRGNSARAPENTLAAVREAVEAGAGAVEMDLRLTSCGQAVLMHDATVERTTDGSEMVVNMSLEEIKKLDAGSWKGEAYAGERVPTFLEAARFLTNKCLVLAEVKEAGLGAALAQAAELAAIRDQLIVLWPGRDPEALADVRRHLPGTPVLEGGDAPGAFSADFFAGRKERGIRGFDYRFETLSADFVSAAHRAGMRVFAWTLNDPKEMESALWMGLDGITTDDPAGLIEVMKNFHT